jgi:import inner membrane translocase subunit TIM44
VGIWGKYATPHLDKAREHYSKTVGVMGRVFRSQMAGVLSQVKEIVPGFALHTFLEDMHDFATVVLEAEFAGDALGLKTLATESYYRTTVNTILARQAADQFTDCKLLDIGPVELLEARIIDRNGQEVPLLHISFSVQQVYCIRNRVGKIKEGGEDKIKAGQYLMGVELVGNTWLCNGVAAQFMTDYH